MSNKITAPSEGVSCHDCGEDYPDATECPVNDHHDVAKARFEPCSLGDACNDDTHHYGLDAHVEQIDD